MSRYALRRVGLAVLVIWAAYTLSFLLLSALPGDAVNNRIRNPDAQISPESAAMLLAYYGLDRPLWQQYLHGIGDALRGDLGFSLSTGKPVTELIGDALPSTAQLTALGLVVGVLLTATIALLTTYAPWSRVRRLAGTAPVLLASVPTFVVGIVLLQLLSFKLGLIPAVDNGTFVALIAPAVTLGLIIAAPLSQVLAASIRGTRLQPYIHVMRAKGAGERYIFGRNVLRNSSLPVLTLLGLAVGELIAGSVITETVFARPGIGQLTVGAVNTQDLPVVQGVVLLSAAAYVVVNLLVDLAYPFIDPRILIDGDAARVRKVRPVRRRAAATTATGHPLDQSRRALPVEVSMP